MGKGRIRRNFLTKSSIRQYKQAAVIGSVTSPRSNDSFCLHAIPLTPFGANIEGDLRHTLFFVMTSIQVHLPRLQCPCQVSLSMCPALNFAPALDQCNECIESHEFRVSNT